MDELNSSSVLLICEDRNDRKRLRAQLDMMGLWGRIVEVDSLATEQPWTNTQIPALCVYRLPDQDYNHEEFTSIKSQLGQHCIIVGTEKDKHLFSGDRFLILPCDFSRLQEHVRDTILTNQVPDVLSHKTELTTDDQERIYRDLFNRGSDANFLIDHSSHIIIDVNQRAQDMYGYSREEMIGMNMLELVCPEEHIKMWQNSQVLKETAVPITRRRLDRKKDGTTMHVTISGSLFEYAGRLVFQDIIRDETERLQAEEKLRQLNEELEERVLDRTQELVELNRQLQRQIVEKEHAQQELQRHQEILEKRVHERTEDLHAANKELEAFTYSVSHDLRPPLRAIHGFTQILMEDYVENMDEEGKRVGSIIQANANKMAQLIEDLLSFSRLGRAVLHTIKVDMMALVNDVYQEITLLEDREHITFKVAELPPAIVDPKMIRQVWMNLISNAVKYSANREQILISITCQVEKDTLVYCIEDNGAGFDMQYQDKLFEVFQRLHNEREYPGTGVGLALVQRIIQRHKGQVWAESQIDKGATFYFSIPRINDPK